MLKRFISLSSACQKKKLNRSSMPPKSSKSSKATKTATTQAETGGDGVISVTKSGDIAVKIHAKPGAKKNGITDISEEGVGVQISAPPVEGEANTELVRYIAEILGLRKGDISLEKGSRSRNKTILVSNGKLSVEEISEKIKKEMGSN